ncbi:hypothetical protein R20233_02043 [Ralstonia sp. LMG 32965]|uniref:hypothetical protein n=1 Tax=Ralstonia flatus TaxID=3058601 RepID=UPI0028F65A20|nr:hypothetical protein [Ralstonia sp. LMG 32965]CAJ0874354.1 hypothetical protein R20233_02043 [Ralstonia sp. LMG 32965]
MRALIYTVLGIWITSLAGCLWVPDDGYNDGRQGGYERDHRGGYEGRRQGGYEGDHGDRDREHH